MSQAKQLDPSENAYKKIPGSYQLGSRIVERLIRRTLTTSGNKTALNTSSYALDLMVYFTTVSDDKNVVHDFSYTEISEFSDMSVRNFYYCIRTLKNFGFISYESTGHGTMDITILNNDREKNKQQGYINTNRTFFIKGTDDFTIYQHLSVYAKKILLLLMLKYNAKFGLRIHMETIASYLGLKNPSLVVSYLDELKDLLGADFYKTEDSSKPKVVISSRFYGLMAYGDYREQETYLKRTIKKAIISQGLTYYDVLKRTMNGRSFKKQMISSISGVFIKYITLGIPFEQLFIRFSSCLHNLNHISDSFIYHLNLEFKEIHLTKSLA